MKKFLFRDLEMFNVFILAILLGSIVLPTRRCQQRPIVPTNRLSVNLQYPGFSRNEKPTQI